MAKNYSESGENHRRTIDYSVTLGVSPFYLGLVMKEASGKREGAYAMPESRERAKIARELYKRHESETDVMLEKYETQLAKIQNGKDRTVMGVTVEKTCKVCKRPSVGRYDACPVCLDVYLSEFRDDFLRHLDTFEATEIPEA